MWTLIVSPEVWIRARGGLSRRCAELKKQDDFVRTEYDILNVLVRSWYATTARALGVLGLLADTKLKDRQRTSSIDLLRVHVNRVLSADEVPLSWLRDLAVG